MIMNICIDITRRVKLNARAKSDIAQTSVQKYLFASSSNRKTKNLASTLRATIFNSIQKTHSLLHYLAKRVPLSSSSSSSSATRRGSRTRPVFPAFDRKIAAARRRKTRARRQNSPFPLKRKMKRTPIQVLVFALLASVDAIFLFARAATQSGTWPLGIYKNQTIMMKNFNTEDNYGGESDGVGEILFQASLTSLTKGELILGSTNHANAADGKHNVGAKIIALQAEQDSIMAELADLTPPAPPPPPPPPPVFITYLAEDATQPKLYASDAAASDGFGSSVSLYGDTALIGAFGDNENGKTDPGSVYVFTRSSADGTFTQQSKLYASDAASSDNFGRSVSLYGNTALIGAPYDDDNNLSTSGSVYVFTRASADGTFTQQSKIHANDPASSDFFGVAVSLYEDTALIGASGDEDGSVYVFIRSSADGSFTQQSKFTSNNAGVDASFGYSVSLHGDTALVGSTGASVDDIYLSGCVYVFTRSSADGTFTEQTQLVPSDSAAFDYFGTSVALYGNEALIGALYDDDNGISNSGSVYVFNSAVSICVDWCKATLVSPNGQVEARVQTDGNFVVYEGETLLWASDTDGQGTGPYALRMQTDGNLVIYDSNEIATWSTDTEGRGSGPYTLVMQDDKNLVIYCNYDVLGTKAPIWSSYYGVFSPINC
jgi:hypothetical protein